MTEETKSAGEELKAIEVCLPNDRCQEAWRREYGIVHIYLNDLAAGALVEVTRDLAEVGRAGQDASDPSENPAVERVAMGLRRLKQELWRLNLARPVIGVFWTEHGLDNTAQALTRLGWDQDLHRGDFSLHRAKNREDAEDLLWTLMGDTMRELDSSLLQEDIALSRIQQAYQDELERQRTLDPDGTMPRTQLLEGLVQELREARQERRSPNLLPVLEDWIQKSLPKGVRP